jgi:hypothetical protein
LKEGRKKKEESKKRKRKVKRERRGTCAVSPVETTFAAGGIFPVTTNASCDALAENSNSWPERFLKKNMGQKLTRQPPVRDKMQGGERIESERR